MKSQVISLLETAGRSLKTGMWRARPETALARYTICQTCYLGDEKRLKPDDKCSACGCYMPRKVNVSQASCPDGHWGPEEKEEPEEK